MAKCAGISKNKNRNILFSSVYPEVDMSSHPRFHLNVEADKMTQLTMYVNKLYAALTASWEFSGQKGLRGLIRR